MPEIFSTLGRNLTRKARPDLKLWDRASAAQTVEYSSILSRVNLTIIKIAIYSFPA